MKKGKRKSNLHQREDEARCRAAHVGFEPTHNGVKVRCVTASPMRYVAAVAQPCRM